MVTSSAAAVRRSLLPVTVAALGLLPACGHRPPPAVDPTLSPALGAQADALAHAAMPGGARLPEALIGVAYGPDQGTEWQVPLQAGQCYVFGYASDPGVARFTFTLWSPSGGRALAARGKPGQGVVNHCAMETGPYRVEGRVASGAGHFVSVVYASGPSAVAAVVGGPVVAVGPQPVVMIGGPAPVVQVAVAGAPPTLGEAIDRQAAAMAPGAARVGDFLNGIGDESEWHPMLSAGACYWFIGAGDPASVKTLSLYLWDPRGGRVTENRSGNERSTLGYCATAPGEYKLEGKVSRRPGPLGPYKVGVYAK